MFENLEDRYIWLSEQGVIIMFWCLCIALFGLPNILPIVLLFILTHGGQMQDNGKDEICKREC